MIKDDHWGMCGVLSQYVDVDGPLFNLIINKPWVVKFEYHQYINTLIMYKFYNGYISNSIILVTVNMICVCLKKSSQNILIIIIRKKSDSTRLFDINDKLPTVSPFGIDVKPQNISVTAKYQIKSESYPNLKHGKSPKLDLTHLLSMFLFYEEMVGKWFIMWTLNVISSSNWHKFI